MKSVIRSIVLKYKLENIPALTVPECEETVMIIRYLIQRCEEEEMLKELENYLMQLEAKLENKINSAAVKDTE